MMFRNCTQIGTSYLSIGSSRVLEQLFHHFIQNRFHLVNQYCTYIAQNVTEMRNRNIARDVECMKQAFASLSMYEEQ